MIYLLTAIGYDIYMIRYMIWYDMIWLYDIWYDMIRYMIYDMVWYDIYYVRYDIWYDMLYMVWYGMIRYDMIYDICGMIWYNMIWLYDMIRYDIWHDRIWCDIWYGMIRYIWCTIWYDIIWYDMIYMVWYDIWYDIFVNCNWVATRRQQNETHIHTNSTQNDTKQTIHRITQKFWKSAGRAPSLRVLPWHLPYNWGKKHGKPSVKGQVHNALQYIVAQRSLKIEYQTPKFLVCYLIQIILWI
jgi:hypothetical protein